MKKNKRHIICTWILLICFAAGQWAVYAHQHKVVAGITKTAGQGTVVSEKCQLCDAMHHNIMLTHNHAYFTPDEVNNHFYKQGQYDFVSIALILSAGRAPPVA